MIATFEALAPIFAMILGGRLLGALAFPAADFWDRAAALAYWILLPALLFRATAHSSLSGTDVTAIAVVVIIPIIAIIGVLTLLRYITSRHFLLDPAFVQSCVRQNTYVALAAGFALWGEEALASLAIVLAIYVPFVNAVSILLLAQNHSPQGGGWRKRSKLLLAVVTNPLVLACLAGIGFAHFEVPLPQVVDATLEIAGHAALPLALLAIGASLRVDVLFGRAGWLALATVIKLIALPLITWSIAAALGLQSVELAVLVLVAAMPAAASAYPLTREMGGDAAFVASAITLQTLVAALTVPIVVRLIESMVSGMPP